MWKDALHPKTDKFEETQTVDLDKWKSVMRSQATSEAKQQVSDEEDASEDNDLKEAEDEPKEGSLLQATRDLVIMWRQAGKLVPEEMTDEEVETLAALPTKSSKRRHLKYLAIKERYRKARKDKQQKRRAEKEAFLEKINEQHITDGEGDDQARPKYKNNTFLLQFWSRSLDKLLGWRSAQAMIFSQPLVFDFSYESNMGRREIENTVSQLMEVDGWNRRATDPFHLHFCNLQPNGAYMQELQKRYGAETWNQLLITSTERQHVDMFPPEQLVYLTADSPNVLKSFDHHKVYVIGALVDRSIQSGLSLANAKRLKLATARLPLDEYLHWEIGAKNLTLDQMIRIMLTLRETGNWEEALKFVPQRKHKGFQHKQSQTINRVRGATNSGPREDGDRMFNASERTFKNEYQGFHRSQNMSRLTGRDRMDGPSGDRKYSCNQITKVI